MAERLSWIDRHTTARCAVSTRKQLSRLIGLNKIFTHLPMSLNAVVRNRKTLYMPYLLEMTHG